MAKDANRKQRLDAFQKIADEYGFTVVPPVIGKRTRHWKWKVENGQGHHRNVTTSKTASCSRALNNQESDIRRACEQLRAGLE